jgi:cyanophycinase-like exopeptidase
MTMQFRIVFETVLQHRLKEFMSADPMYYSGAAQTVPNSQVPDDAWHEVVREDDDLDGLMAQHAQLVAWEAEDQHFVRRSRIERLVTVPVWELL